MLELPWITIFVLYGPLWWLLTIIAIIIITAAIDNDNGTLATITAVITLIAMTCFGTLPLIDYATNNPWTLTAIIAAYFLIGGPIGGIARWYTYVHDELEKYENKKQEWLTYKNIQNKEVPPELKIDWLIYLYGKNYFPWIKITGQKNYDQRNNTDPFKRETIEVIQSYPKVWDNKAKIVTWMTYWPFTLTWLFLDDIVTRWFKLIQQKLANLMDQISRSIFKNTQHDFEIPIDPTKTKEK